MLCDILYIIIYKHILHNHKNTIRNLNVCHIKKKKTSKRTSICPYYIPLKRHQNTLETAFLKLKMPFKTHLEIEICCQTLVSNWPNSGRIIAHESLARKLESNLG